MKAPSKEVSVDKRVSVEDLLKRAERFCVSTYKRPIENEARLRKAILDATEGRPLVLDAGCGTGESSFHLAVGHPESFILGVDKSLSRIGRKNSFKKQMPENALLLTADMQSVWPLLWKMSQAKDIMVEKQYILYPNPWPKAKGLKRRWYANPMLAFIWALKTPVEARSNWRGYLEDFGRVWEHLGGNSRLDAHAPESFISAFERKYAQSGQELFKLDLEAP